MAQNIEIEYRISKVQMWFMTVVALLFDTLQLILFIVPILPWLISILAFCIFWFWFLISGVSTTSYKVLVRFAGSMAIELVPLPFVSMLPLVTIGVASTCMVVRKRDEKEYNKKVKGIKNATRRTSRGPQEAAQAYG